jgi:hypothetical protein
VLNTYGPTKDITYSGKGQSTLEDYLADEAKKWPLHRTGRPSRSRSLFPVDHFSFARAGVPSLTADGGVDDLDQGKEYGKQKHDEYTAKSLSPARRSIRLHLGSYRGIAGC